MKIIRGFIGWICTVFVIGLFGAVLGINTCHVERDKNGAITAVKYD